MPVTTIIGIITMVKQTLTPITTQPLLMAMPTVQTIEMTQNQELFTHPVKLVAKRTTPQENANAANRPPPWNRKPMEQSQSQQQDTEINTIESVQAVAQIFT